MKIIPLKRYDGMYDCYSYLVLGDWNRPSDINTIIDPGKDSFVLGEIERLSTGFGKARVAQVILTHNHSEHTGAVMAIKKRFNAKVLAYSDGPGIDEHLCDGQIIKAGDDVLEVLHTPGHSPDSICLYAPTEKTLFSGETELQVSRTLKTYTNGYVDVLFKIACRDIMKIYSSHDEPIAADCLELFIQTLRNVCRSPVLNDVKGG